MISETWIQVPLGNIASVIKEQYSPNKSEVLKYVGLEHIEQQTLSLNGYGYSDQVASNKFRFEKGDILFGKLRPYFRKLVRPEFSGICSTDILVVRAKSQVNQGFLFYYLANPEFIDFASQGSTGTRMPRADWNLLKNKLVTLPPPRLQHRIAEILSSLDDKIELNRQMNQTLEEMAQAMFKHQFVDGIDPENLPEGWTSQNVYSLAKFINGSSFKMHEYDKQKKGLPIIKIAELKQGIGAQTQYAHKQVDGKVTINTGDILFSWSGNPYTSIDVFIWDKGKALLNQHIFKVDTPSKTQAVYTFFLLKHLMPIFINKATNKQTTGLGHITVADLKAIMINTPSKEIIQSQSSSLVNYFDLLLSNLVETNGLISIREYLLPKLLSGEIIPSDLKQVEQAL